MMGPVMGCNGKHGQAKLATLESVGPHWLMQGQRGQEIRRGGPLVMDGNRSHLSRMELGIYWWSLALMIGETLSN